MKTYILSFFLLTLTPIITLASTSPQSEDVVCQLNLAFLSSEPTTAAISVYDPYAMDPIMGSQRGGGVVTQASLIFGASVNGDVAQLVFRPVQGKFWSRSSGGADDINDLRIKFSSPEKAAQFLNFLNNAGKVISTDRWISTDSDGRSIKSIHDPAAQPTQMVGYPISDSLSKNGKPFFELAVMKGKIYKHEEFIPEHQNSFEDWVSDSDQGPSRYNGIKTINVEAMSFYWNMVDAKDLLVIAPHLSSKPISMEKLADYIPKN